MGLLSAVLVIVVLVVVLLLVVGGARGAGSGAGSLRDLARYSSPSAAGGMVSGLVAALAASSTGSLLGIPVGGSVALGAAVGALFAVLANIGSTAVTSLVLGAFGLAGLAGAVVGLFSGAGCSSVPLGMRVLALAVVGASTGAGILVSLFRGRFHPHSVLGVFGAVRVVTFLASPLGVSVTLLPVAGWIVAIVGAALFGFVAGVAPDLVIGIAALAVTFASVSYGATIGSACSTGADPGDLAVLIGFAISYAIARPLLRWATR